MRHCVRASAFVLVTASLLACVPPDIMLAALDVATTDAADATADEHSDADAGDSGKGAIVVLQLGVDGRRARDRARRRRRCAIGGASRHRADARWIANRARGAILSRDQTGAVRPSRDRRAP